VNGSRYFLRPRGRAVPAIAVTVLLFSIDSLVAGLKTSDEPADLLQRILDRMTENLSRLPNYTCHEIVDRLAGRAGSGSLRQLDRAEFEVAFLGNNEFFAQSGGARFDENSISKMVNGGTIGNGAFASHATAIFAGNIATFQYVGSGATEGHMTYRYDYQVPQEKSHFVLKHGSAEGIVAYRGSFWVDTDTLDLVRLEVKADQIPTHIGVSLVEEVIHYTTLRIRGEGFLLPGKSEMSAYNNSGALSLNMITFAGCREFRGESVVTYGTPAGVNSAPEEP
jgi:hypothetical protein